MKFVTALLALVSQAAAQTTYLSAPEVVFTSNIAPPGIGNECAFASDTLLVCTGSNGSVSGLNPTADPPFVFSYLPEGLSGSATSSSGIYVNGDIIIYSVTVDGTACRVEGVGFDGVSVWTSEELNGACSGTPTVSSDGRYTFVTHNPPADLSGIFTILDGADTLYQFTDDQPLSPPGIYHNPAFGNYAGGEQNANDIVVFCNTLIPSEDGVSADAESFAFQFPVGFTGAVDTLSVATLLTNTNWKSVAPPLLTQSGTKMHWGVSRGDLLAWTDREFSRDVGGFRTSLGRGTPSFQPINAEITADSTETFLYSGSAGNDFHALVAENLEILWTVPTTSPIYAQSILSPDESVVYIIEQNGLVQAIDTATGAVNWELDATLASVFAGFAQSSAGDVIYFADSTGILNGWKVADVVTTPTTVPPPSDMPAAAPTDAPGTDAPATMAPVSMESGAPATGAPVGPSEAPVTMAPVVPTVSGAPVTTAPVAATEAPASMAPATTESMAPATGAPASPSDAPVMAAPVPDPTSAPVPPPTTAPVTTEAPSSACTTNMLALVVVAIVGFFM